MNATSPIYLDYNSTTPVLDEVVEAMLPCFTSQFGNPSSIHSCGQRALEQLKLARQRLAAFLGCLPTEIVFTSGAPRATTWLLRASCARAIISLSRRSNIARSWPPPRGWSVRDAK